MSSESVWQVSFPPFYTLQKHSETQKKQIDTWCHLLLEFSTQNNKQVIDLNEIRQTSLFSNSEIDRRARARSKLNKNKASNNLRNLGEF